MAIHIHVFVVHLCIKCVVLKEKLELSWEQSHTQKREHFTACHRQTSLFELANCIELDVGTCRQAVFILWPR